MSASSHKRLPVNPSLENLKKQAKRLAKARPELSLQQAQHQLAVEYGSANWTELAHVVETMSRGSTQTTNVKNKMEPLPAAANYNDLAAVERILKDGPFTQHDLDLARDLPRLAEYRRTLRTRMQTSPLMNAPRFTQNLGAAYRQMWRDWCAS